MARTPLIVSFVIRPNGRCLRKKKKKEKKKSIGIHKAPSDCGAGRGGCLLVPASGRVTCPLPLWTYGQNLRARARAPYLGTEW
jgi:hypothetical protein